MKKHYVTLPSPRMIVAVSDAHIERVAKQLRRLVSYKLITLAEAQRRLAVLKGGK